MRNRMMMALMVASISMLLLMDIVQAGTATVSWNNPTTKTDGTALPASQILRTEVEYSTSSTFATIAGTATATGAAESVVITALPPSTFYFRAFTVAGGGRSAASNVVSKVVPDSPPSPPTLITVNTTAYVIQPGWFGMLRMVKVSGVSLPLGMSCDSTLPGVTGYGIAGGYIAQCRSS